MAAAEAGQQAIELAMFNQKLAEERQEEEEEETAARLLLQMNEQTERKEWVTECCTQVSPGLDAHPVRALFGGPVPH